MTRNQFIKSLMEQLHSKAIYERIRYFEDGYTSEIPTELALIRETNLKYHKKESDILIGDFLVLTLGKRSSGRLFDCRFEMDYLFESYQEGGWNQIWEIIDANLEYYQKMMNSDVIQLLGENDYEMIKNHLFIRPLHYPSRKHELGDAIYRIFGDIALVLYVLISDYDDEERHNVTSARMHRDTITEWNIPEDEVFESALLNTYLMAPPRMYINPLDTYKPPYQKGAFMALTTDMNSLSDKDAPIVTTTRQTNGAIALFYPGVTEKIAQMYDDDYYVAFTSVNEAHLHKVGCVPPENILQSIERVNRIAATMTDILTEKVYLYKRETQTLEPVELP